MAPYANKSLIILLARKTPRHGHILWYVLTAMHISILQKHRSVINQRFLGYNIFHITIVFVCVCGLNHLKMLACFIYLATQSIVVGSDYYLIVKFILSSFIFHLWCNWWCEWKPNFVILVCFFPSLSLSFPCVIRVPFIFDDTIYEGIAIQGLFLDCLRILVTLPFHLVSMKKGTVWLK